MKQNKYFFVFAFACFFSVLTQASEPELLQQKLFETPEGQSNDDEPVTPRKYYNCESNSFLKDPIESLACTNNIALLGLLLTELTSDAAREKIAELKQYFLLLNNENFENGSNGMTSNLSEEFRKVYNNLLPEERKVAIESRIKNELTELSLMLQEGTFSPERQEALLHVCNRINGSLSSKQQEFLGRFAEHAHSSRD